MFQVDGATILELNVWVFENISNLNSKVFQSLAMFRKLLKYSRISQILTKIFKFDWICGRKIRRMLLVDVRFYFYSRIFTKYCEKKIQNF